VYPLKIITVSPFPKGLLPRAKKGAGKALADYRPDDDTRLLACTAVPLSYRLLWGFLAREGMRSSEAIQLRWGDVDLDDGSVVLDENKSDDPRSWALDPAVVRALDAFKPDGAEPSDRVFVEANGGEHNRHALAKTLREHLKLAGLEEGGRAKLFEHSKTRLQVRAHDLRAAFVTTALANGKTETWVADRTGHKSHSMIKRYTRTARTAGDLKRGNWTALDVALGLAKPSKLSQKARRRRGSAGTATGTE
jgi:integrase